jgi:transcription-repair coupling factor (superfamily II helicase)
MSKAISAGIAAVQLLELAERSGAAGLIHVTTSERRAWQIGRFLSAAAPDVTVLVFPPWDCLPYDRVSPSRDVMGKRMAALWTLANAGERGPIVITTPDAALQRVPPKNALRSFEIRAGQALDPEELHSFCDETGYVIDERVDEAGEAAFRGETIDIFPAGHRLPFRLEIQDGRVQAIRCFDPLSQRTESEVRFLRLHPASELPVREGADQGCRQGAEHRLADAYLGLETVFDYLPRARLVEDPRAADRREAVLEQISEAYRDRTRAKDVGSEIGAPVLAPDRFYLDEDGWRELLAERGVQRPTGERFKPVPDFATATQPGRAFADFLREQLAERRRVVLAAAADGDLARLSRSTERITDRRPEAVDSWKAVLTAAPGTVAAFKAELEDGFIDAEAEIAVVSAGDVLGSRAQGADEKSAAIAPWQAEVELRFGDLVVHVDHGVGVLRCLEQIQTPQASGEAIRLAYAKDAGLLVPADEADRLWRYGSQEGAVALDRLNTQGWTTRRTRIEAALEKTARALIASAAERERLEAAKLVPPSREYERFVARFPFAETADQRRAIEAVLTDLASGRPMDRLVVGDVGFGKTEVALRAAAAAALAGKQVAVVAPTTVLAHQHFNTFSHRFAGLGVEVAHLSRLVTGKEARRVRAGLADGSIHVAVGTHVLAGKTVSFADLGLLIIDEEHRFGVADKQKLRRLAESAHVLALTATPIPRTLQTALTGLQDLSSILTAPLRRRPIRTFSTPFDAETVRTALRREKRRGGQSFVVVPRIEDIEPVARQLETLAPELDVRVAHGKLPAGEVDVAMVDFAEGRGDVLLATSIIESGLDVPRANTMVVLRADLFGLAELHQLRGRVGRSHVQAVCYLMTEPDKELPETTARRLGTLQAFDRLGAGMAIAARDLDLRGAGDLIGEEQAGHVNLIGLGLYQELLAEAVRKARGEAGDRWETEFQIDAPASVPDDYIPEPEIRLNLYHRAARASEPADVERLADEIADRFGPPPAPVQSLLALAGARTLARSLKVLKINAGPQAVALEFEPGVDPEQAFAQSLKRLDGELEWTGERLLLQRSSDTPEERLGLVLELLEELG